MSDLMQGLQRRLDRFVRHNLTLPPLLSEEVHKRLGGAPLSTLVARLLTAWLEEQRAEEDGEAADVEAARVTVGIGHAIARRTDTAPPVWHHACPFRGDRWMARLPPTWTDDEVIADVARVRPCVVVIQRTATAVVAYSDPLATVERARRLGLWRPMGRIVEVA